MNQIARLLPLLLRSTLTTLEIFCLTLIFSIPLGLVVVKAKMSRLRVLSAVTNIYIMIMRGTPLILQLIFVYFAPYYLFGISTGRFAAVIVAFVINYAAYFAEVYRSGIQSIGAGQHEACAVLGLSRWDSFFSIILPQVVKKVLPAMGNEVITLVKDTALAQTIGVEELFRSAQNASSRAFSTVPIFVAGVFYFIMNAIVSKSFDLMEKSLDYYKL